VTSVYGDNSGLFGHIYSLKQSGSTDENIGNHVLWAVTRHLGYGEGLPNPTDDKDFSKNFESHYNKLPTMAKNQISQMAAMAKFSFDIYNEMKGGIGEDTLAMLDPDNKGIRPIMKDNFFGINVGGFEDGTDILFSLGEDSMSTKYLFMDSEGNIDGVTVKQEEVRDAEMRFVANMVPLFKQSDAVNLLNKAIVYDNPRAKLGKQIDTGAVTTGLQKVIEANYNTKPFQENADAYLEVVNRQIIERNSLLGTNDTTYKAVELYVDKKSITSLAQEGRLQSADLRSLIKYRLIPNQISHE